jgi:hypothetical protein
VQEAAEAKRVAREAAEKKKREEVRPSHNTIE